MAYAQPLSFTEENYLKAIYSLSERAESFDTSTNEIALKTSTKPPTVSDMLRKLAEKKLVTYEKYKRVQLTKSGRHIAIQIILEKFLGYPTTDPHGDPIPSANGELPQAKRIILSDTEEGKTYHVVGVKDSTSPFLQYLQHLNIGIGTKIRVIERIPYDGSLTITMKKGQQISVSKKFADNVLVTV
jgi:DtxR family transcriptional regulator, Mn-dependent transcriptional regulator